MVVHNGDRGVSGCYEVESVVVGDCILPAGICMNIGIVAGVVPPPAILLGSWLIAMNCGIPPVASCGMAAALS